MSDTQYIAWAEGLNDVCDLACNMGLYNLSPDEPHRWGAERQASYGSCYLVQGFPDLQWCLPRRADRDQRVERFGGTVNILPDHSRRSRHCSARRLRPDHQRRTTGKVERLVACRNAGTMRLRPRIDTPLRGGSLSACCAHPCRFRNWPSISQNAGAISRLDLNLEEQTHAASHFTSPRLHPQTLTFPSPPSFLSPPHGYVPPHSLIASLLFTTLVSSALFSR